MKKRAWRTTRQGRYKARKPWVRHVEYARRRCTDPSHKSYKWYGGKGLACHLTAEDAAFLWERDGAAEMACPSLDRVESALPYSRENCRFIERDDNALLASKNLGKELMEAVLDRIAGR